MNVIICSNTLFFHWLPIVVRSFGHFTTCPFLVFFIDWKHVFSFFTLREVINENGSQDAIHHVQVRLMYVALPVFGCLLYLLKSYRSKFTPIQINNLLLEENDLKFDQSIFFLSFVIFSLVPISVQVPGPVPIPIRVRYCVCYRYQFFLSTLWILVHSLSRSVETVLGTKGGPTLN